MSQKVFLIFPNWKRAQKMTFLNRSMKKGVLLISIKIQGPIHDCETRNSVIEKILLESSKAYMN